MRHLLIAILLLSVVDVGEGQQKDPEDILVRSTLTEQERLLGLSTLWSETRFSFAYFDNLSANWDLVYQQFIPRVVAAHTDYDYFLELMRFQAHLKDGHSGVFWPLEFDQALGYPPLEIRKIQGRAVIFRCLKQTEELTRNHIRPGLAILEVDGKPVNNYVAYWRELKTASTEQATDRLDYFRILTGPRNSSVEVRLQEPDGGTRSVRLTRSEKYFNDTNLAPPELFSSRQLDSGIGYFQANQMSPDAGRSFERFIQSAGAMKGLILDLRYNGGGSDLVSFAMVSQLIDQPLDGPIYEVTSYRADLRAEKKGQTVVRESPRKITRAASGRFTGPLLVLIGEQTQSATEGGFLSVIRNRRLTTFVGEPTAGSSGQPLPFKLPGGGIGAVCSRRTLGPDGRVFVGVGFQPDVKVTPTQQDLFVGRDAVLEKAIEILHRRISELSPDSEKSSPAGAAQTFGEERSVGEPSRWSAIALADLNFIRTALIENHPGPVDPENPRFKALLEEAYRAAQIRAGAASSYAAYYFLLKRFAATFEDGHLQVSLDGSKLNYYWPGFLIELRGRNKFVVGVASSAGEGVRQGQELVSCDGVSAEQLGELVLQPQFGQWDLPGARVRLAPSLLIDQGDPYVKRPSRCVFRADSAYRSVALNWKLISLAELKPLLQRARHDVERKVEARWVRPGYYWISVGSFASGNEMRRTELQELLKQIKSDRMAISQASVMVFDVRGNGGGASDWGELIAGAIWGDDYIRSIAPRASIVDWRASAGNLAHFERGILPRFAEQFGKESPQYREWDAVARGLRTALARGETFARQNEEVEPRPADAVPATVRGHVFVLTDGGCASACLDFLDLLSEVPNLIRVGSPTSADTFYIDNRSVQLPSGLGSLGISMKVYRDRKRGSKQSYSPRYSWSGSMDDTAGLERWILGLANGAITLHGYR